MKDSYFQAYNDYFWEWESSSEEVVASVPQSVTIAYRQHVFEIVALLAPQGLPPFGSMLLAMVALNSATGLERILEIFSSKLSRPDEEVLHDALRFLKLLNTLPLQYKVQEKAVLVLQTLFENCHNKLSVKDSAEIANWCKNDLHLFSQMVSKKGFLTGVFRYDFRPIGLLGHKYKTVEDIIARIGALPTTDQLKIQFEEAPTLSKPSTDLVDQLIENEKTFTTGSLVRWLWGGLNIPVHSALPSRQPLGGISDLTNKGDFDKLLISEFAYDDITFLSRLANNEALYIHREIPPTNNNLNRIILIDASIRNWGNPKTMAFAIMLAIARHPKTDITCHAYVLGSEQYYAVAFETVDDIINGMQIVEGSLHANKSLAAFFKDHEADQNKEVFLITEATTTRNPDMARALNDYHDQINYIVFTDSDGTVDLFKRHQRARKHLQQIKLPLQKLWTRDGKNGAQQVPAIAMEEQTLSEEIPILVKGPGMPKRIVNGPDGEIFQLSNEGAILKLFDRYASNQKGWELLQQSVPKTAHFEIGFSESNEYVALLFDVPAREILLINLSSSHKITTKFNHWKSTDLLSFIYHSGKFYHVNPSGVWSISLDGTIVASDDVQFQHVRERHQQLEAVIKKYATFNNTPFKNIHTVYVNKSKKIVLNNAHELHFDGKQLVFRPAQDTYIVEQARRTSHEVFTFNDGSTVSVNRCGFIVLKSSKRTLPPIYIPTVLQGALGVATDDSFAGNEFYFKEKHTEISLQAMMNPLTAMKKINELFGLDLKDIKTLVGNYPFKFPGRFSNAEAIKIRKEFSSVGATVSLNSLLVSQERMTMDAFYTEKCVSYIETITRYGV